MNMLYISGQHALNIPCALLTCGDWHQSALQWNKPFFRDSNDSIFGEYGIEKNKSIPEHNEKYNVANHIRALLDLIELNQFSLAQGMNNDFICNDKYTNEIFTQVTKLYESPTWYKIDDFMGKEYLCEWLEYKKAHKYSQKITPLEQVINNEINVCNINELCIIKTTAYMSKNKIKDLYDLSFIYSQHFNKLSPDIVAITRNALSYKGIEHFNYLIQTQTDEQINKEKLSENFLIMLDKLGLIYHKEETDHFNKNNNYKL